MPLPLVSAVGLAAMMLLAWLLGTRQWRVNWRIVLGGLALQFALAAVMMHTPPGRWLFVAIDAGFNQLDTFKNAGVAFLFGINAPGDEAGYPPSDSLIYTFAFGVLPTILVFASLMSILYYLGVMQLVVKGLAWLMQKTFGASGAESLAAAANVFVGHTEAPLVVKPYIASMTLSELNAMMVGGFATITGGLLAAYAAMGISPGHLVTASVISAPAALLIAKLMVPESEEPKTLGHVSINIPRQGVNIIEAAALGVKDGLKLAVNVGAMLLVFLALIAMLNALIAWIGSWFGLAWSLEAALGLAFWPLAWLMGIETGDCQTAGQLLGLKMVANEFIAYAELGKLVQATSPPLSERSIHILTYALSGFSNFGAVGIQIGGIGGLAPNRSADLARLGLRAMFGGMLACCMTGCVAGILL